jgi:hypothetical protein
MSSELENDDEDAGEDSFHGQDDLARAIHKMRMLSRGGPWIYSWDSPVGRFQICLGIDDSDGAVWRLEVRETFAGTLKVLGTYPDYIDAMLAVCNRKTGWLKWDHHPDLKNLPKDSADWEELG